MAVEQKYDQGDGMRGYKAADYQCEVSVCKGQELGRGGGAKAPYLPPSSATLETKYKIQNLKILLTLQIRLTLQY